MLRALLITVSNAGSDGAYSAVLTEKIQETTRIMTRLTPQQRHDLEESRRRAIAQLSKAELSTLHDRRRQAMAHLSPQEFTALQEQRAAVMADDQ